MFLKILDVKLPKHLDIYKYIISLKKNKQLLYKPIYSLGHIKSENFKLKL